MTQASKTGWGKNEEAMACRWQTKLMRVFPKQLCCKGFLIFVVGGDSPSSWAANVQTNIENQ